MNELVTLVVTDNDDFKQEVVSLIANEHSLTFVSSLQQAPEILQNPAIAIGSVICDMPLDLTCFESELRKFKRNDCAKYIPIVGILHHDSDSAQISRQLFYHLLSRPFQNDILSHTLEGAHADFKRYQSLINEVNSRTSAIGLIESGMFALQTLQQAEALTTMLSLACPEPSCVALGLSELLVNAIEHGNLGITYTEKSSLLEQGVWDKEIKKRLNDPLYKDRVVEVSFIREEDCIRITITDQGDGFDWQKFIESDPNQFNNKHGRGIAIAIAMGFSSLTYNEKGNQAVATINL